MKSIKLHEDTVAALRAAKVREGISYDSVIHQLLTRQAASIDPVLQAGDQLDRIELLLLQISDQLQKDPEKGPIEPYRIS